MNHINGWISSPFEQRPCRPRSDQKQHVSRPAIQSSLQAASVTSYLLGEKQKPVQMKNWLPLV